MPTPPLTSSSALFALSSQATFSGGQVVNSMLASEMRLSLETSICSAEPRAGRVGRSKPAAEKLTVSLPGS